MANPARETELTHIQTDAAAHSQSSDQQIGNRLQLEVNHCSCYQVIKVSLAKHYQLAYITALLLSKPTGPHRQVSKAPLMQTPVVMLADTKPSVQRGLVTNRF